MKTRLEAGYQRLKVSRHFGRYSSQSYFAADELLARQLEATTITPQAAAVLPILPRLEDEPSGCWVARWHLDQNDRREGRFQRIHHLGGGHLQPT